MTEEKSYNSRSHGGTVYTSYEPWLLTCFNRRYLGIGSYLMFMVNLSGIISSKNNFFFPSVYEMPIALQLVEGSTPLTCLYTGTFYLPGPSAGLIHAIRVSVSP